MILRVNRLGLSSGNEDQLRITNYELRIELRNYVLRIE